MLIEELKKIYEESQKDSKQMAINGINNSEKQKAWERQCIEELKRQAWIANKVVFLTISKDELEEANIFCMNFTMKHGIPAKIESYKTYYANTGNSVNVHNYKMQHCIKAEWE